ncbi:MAG TPA: glutathione S-transferase N-terminal domain-containing protein [Solirubrobacteraceae bacterium]|jgi:glutathione S-transferase|nr:glutathione S-transferase N-terminal domain-containing protein [Solirubrobacteraceae bacterium]
MRTRNRLITIPISHYCEKARWALDRASVDYREHAHVQAIHRFATLRAGGGLTAPVFVSPTGVLAESADILAWADAQTPPELALYPQDPTLASEVRRLEADFDERLGPHSRRWMYQHLRGRRDLALRYGCVGIPRWEQATLRGAYPAIIAIVAKVLDVNPASAAESEIEVRAIFDAVGERLTDGRRYLCGERFTAADLTFAALAAPMLMPAEYGVPLPQPEEIPPYAASVVRELRAHPAGTHALGIFASERRR